MSDTHHRQSKFVAEKLVEKAQQLGLPVSIFRAGTLTGDSLNGASNAEAFINKLLCGIIQMKCAPVLPNAQIDLTPGMLSSLGKNVIVYSGCSSKGHSVYHPQFFQLEQSVSHSSSSMHVVLHAHHSVDPKYWT